METTELKELWKQYDAKLEKNWNLNLKLVKDMNLEKTKSSINTFTMLKGFTIIFQLMVVSFLTNFLIDNFSNLLLAAQGGILLVLTYVALIWNVYQMTLIMMINYNEPVLAIQKKIEKLKIQKLRYNKFIFYSSYPFVFLMAFTVLHISPVYFPIWWMIPNIILAILWFPMAYWLIRKYNSPNLLSPFWKQMAKDSSLTPDSVSKALNNSLSFLKEIEQFESVS